MDWSASILGAGQLDDDLFVSDHLVFRRPIALGLEAEGHLVVAVELVDALARLALGVFRGLVDLEVDGLLGLGSETFYSGSHSRGIEGLGGTGSASARRPSPHWQSQCHPAVPTKSGVCETIVNRCKSK
jgi:hypothetical protein